MKTINEYLNDGFEDYLTKKGLALKKIESNHYAIFNSDYCIKIYDRPGHGYNINVNIARTYNESVYEKDECNLYWAMKYFGLVQSSDFSSRKPEDYESNLPLLMNDLKKLIGKLDTLSEIFWNEGIPWINIQANKKFN